MRAKFAIVGAFLAATIALCCSLIVDVGDLNQDGGDADRRDGDVRPDAAPDDGDGVDSDVAADSEDDSTCDPSACDATCRSIGAPGGSCVGAECRCDVVADADADSDAACSPTESDPIACDDGLDNDCDGRIDCRDLQCLPFCCTSEVCADGEDNDCDGRVDCDDGDCCTTSPCGAAPVCDVFCCVPGTTRWCDVPAYTGWGVQDCRPEGWWGTCEETGLRPPGCDDGSYYYSSACCVSAGECCQNIGHDVSLPPEASVGDCVGIVAACA